MKNIRSAARSNAMSKLHKMGGHHGPHSSKMHKACGGGMKGYASGGAVNDQGGMGVVEGGSAKGRLDRPGRSMKGKKDKGKKGGTNVNVIVMPGGKGGDAAPPMMPPHPMPAGPPMPPGPMPPPHMAGPMPPPPMGGPPGGMPPMHKHGGKVKSFKRGGKVHKADGGSLIDDEMPKLPDKGLRSMGFDRNEGVVRKATQRLKAANEVENNMDRATDKIKSNPPWNEDSSIAKKRGGKVMKKKH